MYTKYFQNLYNPTTIMLICRSINLSIIGEQIITERLFFKCIGNLRRARPDT